LNDIMKELDKPGLDPRGEAKAFQFGNVKTLEDLHVGMTLPGIVTNLTNFGAFVDVGVKQDGLVHISQITNRFIKSPSEVLKLQQHVQVRIVEVDINRKRVMLSMKDV
jgi:protein Tex